MGSYFMDNVSKMVKYWWLSVAVGILAIVMGIWCLSTPINTFQTLTIVFAFGFLFKGILEIIFSVSNKNLLRNWGWQLLFGIIDFVFGLILVSSPAVVAAVTLLYFTAFWIMFQSGISFGISIDMINHKIPGAVLSAILSGLCIILSLILLTKPALLAGVIIYLVSFSFIFYGFSRIILGFKLKSIHKEVSN